MKDSKPTNQPVRTEQTPTPSLLSHTTIKQLPQQHHCMIQIATVVHDTDVAFRKWWKENAPNEDNNFGLCIDWQNAIDINRMILSILYLSIGTSVCALGRKQ